MGSLRAAYSLVRALRSDWCAPDPVRARALAGMRGGAPRPAQAPEAAQKRLRACIGGHARLRAHHPSLIVAGGARWRAFGRRMAAGSAALEARAHYAGPGWLGWFYWHSGAQRRSQWPHAPSAAAAMPSYALASATPALAAQPSLADGCVARSAPFFLRRRWEIGHLRVLDPPD